MSIFKVLDNNIAKGANDFSEFLDNLKGDTLRGVEFMFYGLSNIFKDKDNAELEVGIVDASYREERYDFGIDAIYITGSSDFIEQPEQLSDYNEDTKFKIHLFQFKRGPGISQGDILKFNTGVLKSLIDDSITDSDNLYFYNRLLVLNEIKLELFNRFRPENINVCCHFVFGGLESSVRSESILIDELAKIEDLLKSHGYINGKIMITDAQMLINASSNTDEIIDIIEYQKTLKYITEIDTKTKLNGYISIVNGKDIADLVRRHQSSIFEANIRDYYKRSDLNSKIIETSASLDEAKFFWSYNNGLTMTCSRVDELPQNKYRLHSIQIVNGCQTSNAIYLALKNRERVEELKEKLTNSDLTTKETQELGEIEKLQFNFETSVLVKIIETKNEDLIYRITETTNSQTPIKAFSLKANDDIQKFIEKYLDQNAVNYERRINSLRNQGKKNVYSIQKLFQLYTSQILFKPSQVKTRPKKMFIDTYDNVFPDPKVRTINFDLYLIPILVDIYLNKAVKDYLKGNPELDPFQKTLISYGNYHMGCFILSSILRADYNEKGIVTRKQFVIDQLKNNIDAHLVDAIDSFSRLIKTFAGSRKEVIPGAVKKTDLDARIVRLVKTRR